MVVVCVAVLTLASVAAGSSHPGAFGVKAGAAAKAEASALSGAFGGLPAPAALSGAGGGAYSSSFSKSSASSFASSSASSSSYAYSGGFSGGIPGGINGIGGAGCSGSAGCLHNIGVTAGSGAYSGSIPIDGATGPGLNSSGSGTGAYAGSVATGISSVGPHSVPFGSGAYPFSDSTPVGSTSPGHNNVYSVTTTGSYNGAVPVGTISSRPTTGSGSGAGQYSNPTSTVGSSTGTTLATNSNSAAALGTASLSDTDYDSKYPTNVSKRPCSGDCANSGSSSSLNCEGSSCNSPDSKCTSSQCQLTSPQKVSSTYNNNDIPVSVSGTNILKPSYGSDSISSNEGNNKDSTLGPQCDTPNCKTPTQSNKENLYDGQYTSYNPKPSTVDTSVYGGQPHKCTSPSCTQSSQYAPGLSSSSESSSQFRPTATDSTSLKETPKGSTICNTPNCGQEPKKPNSYESNANLPQTVVHNQGSSKPHNIYPELTPSKGSPCGLADCDNYENPYPYATGNVLPLTPTYNQNVNYKPSGPSCGTSGCGTPSFNTPSGNSYFSSRPQGISPSSPRPSVPNCGVSGCGTQNYNFNTPSGSYNFPSSSIGSSTPRPESSYTSSTPQGISSTKPPVINCGPSGCGSPNFNTPSGNSYFSSSPQQTFSSSPRPSIPNCGPSGCGSPNFNTPSGNSYFSSSPQGTFSSSPRPSVPNCGVSGCETQNYNTPSGSSHSPTNFQESSNPVSESSYISSSSQGIATSKPTVINCGSSGCGAPNYNAPFGSSYFPSSPQSSSSPGSDSGSSHFPSNSYGSVSPVSQGLTPPKPGSGTSYFPSNSQGSFQSTTPSGSTIFSSNPQGTPSFASVPGSFHLPPTSQGLSPSTSVPSGQGAFGCVQTGSCGNYPSSSTNVFGMAGVSTGSHIAIKPISTSDNKGPTYTGGFGAPAGFLKPNDYSVPVKPEYVSQPQPFPKPNLSSSSVLNNQLSPTAGMNSGQLNPNIKPIISTHTPIPSHNYEASSSAAAGANAVVYTGGFGGPPGLLQPYDNGKISSTSPYHQGNTVSGISGSNYDQGVLAMGIKQFNGVSSDSNPAYGGSLVGAGATAVAGAGARAVTGAGVSTGTSSKFDKHDNVGSNSEFDVSTGQGGCRGECGSIGTGLTGGAKFSANGNLAKTGLISDLVGDLNTAGAAAKSSASAVSGTENGGFGGGRSFASSSASAHASAVAGTKGGYGKR